MKEIVAFLALIILALTYLIVYAPPLSADVEGWGPALLPTQLANKTRNAGGSMAWPKASEGFVVIPYVVTDQYDKENIDIAIDAMAEFDEITCVRFVPRRTETDFLLIDSRSGCKSIIGKLGELQKISLEKMGCMNTGIIQHELEHALGFYHEHSRSDRDTYVKIMWENISPDNVRMFDKEMNMQLGLPYEYTSIMHYARYVYSIEGDESIDPAPNGNVPIGQRDGISQYDIAKINKLYNCAIAILGFWPCGGEIEGTSGRVTTQNFPQNYANSLECNYVIELTNGRRVELQLQSIGVEKTDLCVYDYLMIIDGNGIKVDMRMCGTEYPALLVSETNRMWLTYITDGSARGFVANYRLICGRSITESKTGVLFPNQWPGSYPPNDCVFTIKAQGQIFLAWPSFEVEPDPACVWEYVGLLSGLHEVSSRYCGGRVPPVIKSSYNAISLEFVSDTSVNKLGFWAHYSGRDTTAILR
uniref:Metalloendopeptidase n=1 Tax=Astacus astacus TaxID=6715 RepID=O44072_ASTAS|nr:astacus egg astacin [Astacus astacus]